jgi:AraC family transcriptional activator of pyochelin receptor
MDKINTANWADYFGEAEAKVVHASDRYTETVLEFKEPSLASGKIRAVATPGMVLTELSLQSNQPFQLIDSEPKESAESLFVLEGNVESRFSYLTQPLHFSSRNHNLQYSTSFAGSHIIHSGDFQALTITYDLPYLNSLLQSNENTTLEKLGKNVYRKENYLATRHGVNWDGRIAEAIQSVRQSKFQGSTQYIFIESKMMELFVLQMEHLHTLQLTTTKEKWRKEDQEKIFAVKEYLDRAYLDPLTMKDLTYEFGLNEFKLKKGYKHFFNTTVFGYILHLRMLKAKALLSDPQMTISDVAQFIGYNNTGSFSYEFKKRFGYSPSQRGR